MITGNVHCMKNFGPLATSVLGNFARRSCFFALSRILFGIVAGTLIGLLLNFEYEAEFNQLNFGKFIFCL